MELNNKQLGTLTALGEKLAHSLMAIDAKADSSKRDMLLNLASKNLDKARYTIVLDSYQKTLIGLGMSENTAKVRKSEALQVIKAVALTEVSGDNLGKLNAFEGNYNAFIDYARKLQVKEVAIAKSASEKTVKPLSDKGAKIVSDNMAKANNAQLHSFISEAVATINQKQAPTMAGLNVLKLVNNIVNTALKNGDIEPYIIEQLKALEAISNNAIVKVEKAQNDALASQKAVAGKYQEEALL